MSAYSSAVVVKQQACIRAGVDPITSESQSGWRTTVLNAAYEPIVEDVLARHAWKCCLATILLTYAEELDFGVWRYAYDDPSPSPKKLINHKVFLGNPADGWSDYTRRRFVPHDFVNGQIVANVKYDTDDEGLVLLYGERAPEASWSPGLAEGIVKAVSGVVARQIKKDQLLGAAFERDAEMTLMRASAREAEQFARRRQGDHQLIDAWVSGSRRY